MGIAVDIGWVERMNRRGGGDQGKEAGVEREVGEKHLPALDGNAWVVYISGPVPAKVGDALGTQWA
jgi:hypothetical protein